MAKIIQLTKPEVAQGQLGGYPNTGGDLDWPKCRTCAGNMQFIAEFPLHVTGLPVFRVMEEEWEAESKLVASV